ncbi:MAG TPA: hypothetical protein VFG93_06740 [Gaiellaceae bacterium]|nr:hypothetical protein [Gaiellaceae bacterium]
METHADIAEHRHWPFVRRSALKLPMAATAWVFGLNHFSHVTNRPGPIVLGSVLLFYAVLRPQPRLAVDEVGNGRA